MPDKQKKLNNTLVNKVAIITGGSFGLGFEITKFFFKCRGQSDDLLQK